METPSVNISELQSLILANMTVGIPTGIFGQVGVGKTAIIEQIASMIGMEYRIVSVSDFNPIEIAGLWGVVDGKTLRFPTDIIPFDRPVFVLVDELGDCPAHEQSTWYRFVKEQMLGNMPLTAGSYVCFATNRPEDNAAARELSSAMKDRACCVTLRADWRCTVKHAISTGWNQKVVAFVKAFGQEVVDEGFDPDGCPYAGCTPRGLERLSKLENANAISKKNPALALAQCVGNIGISAGAKYASFRLTEIDDPQLVFVDPKTAPIYSNSDIAKACCYCAAVIGCCEDNELHFSRVADYALRNHRVIGCGLFNDLASKYRSFRSSPSFARLAAEYGELYL